MLSINQNFCKNESGWTEEQHLLTQFLASGHLKEFEEYVIQSTTDFGSYIRSLLKIL